MSICYEPHIDFPEKILVREFHEEVIVSDIINSWKELINMNLITKELKGVINNLNYCNLNLNLESFEELVQFLTNSEQLHHLKLAVICNSPNKIIFPILGDEKVEKIKIKPFTTIDAAANWIME